MKLKIDSDDMPVDLLKKLLVKYKPTRTTFEAERIQGRYRIPLMSSSGRLMDHALCKPENTIKIVIELENLEDDEMVDIIKMAGVEVDGEFR